METISTSNWFGFGWFLSEAPLRALWICTQNHASQFTRSLSFVVVATLYHPSEWNGACVQLPSFFQHLLNEWIPSEWVSANEMTAIHCCDTDNRFVSFALSSNVFTHKYNCVRGINKIDARWITEFVGWSCAHRLNVGITTNTETQLVSTIAITFLLLSYFSNGRVNRVTQFLVRAVFLSIHQPTNRSAYFFWFCKCLSFGTIFIITKRPICIVVNSASMNIVELQNVSDCCEKWANRCENLKILCEKYSHRGQCWRFHAVFFRFGSFCMVSSFFFSFLLFWNSTDFGRKWNVVVLKFIINYLFRKIVFIE